MTMRERQSNADASRAELYAPTKSIGHDNARYKNQNIWYYINNGGALNAPTVLKGHYIMANSEIFIATAADMTLAFSSIGPAFQFIKDSHADLCAEGSALMLADVPATSKQVKDSYRRVLRFTVTGADSASQVAAAQSALDGALQACELVGVDPRNVSKVAELQVALDAARESVNDDLDAPELTITRMTLHKRGYKRS